MLFSSSTIFQTMSMTTLRMVVSWTAPYRQAKIKDRIRCYANYYSDRQNGAPSSEASLKTIDTLHRWHVEDFRGPCAPHSRSVLSAIINGTLNDPPPMYGTATPRQEAISLVDPTLQEDVDDHLYHTCMLLKGGYARLSS